MTTQSESALTDFITKCVQRRGYKGDPEMYASYEPWLYELAKAFVEAYEANDLHQPTLISQEAALAILDKIDKVRRDARKQRQLTTDYYLRVACAIVAEAGGFEDRTNWTNILKSDLTSEYAKDYDDPEFATLF